jgi:hypothetical protein
MYFSSDSPDTPAVAAALGNIVRQKPELQWLALLDGAFDYGLSDLPLPNERHTLYDYGNMSDLLEASPFILALTVDDETRLQSELLTLLRHRKERPMLSFIGTMATAHSINENFRFFANALTDDRQEFLLRFADTRVLPGLPSALRPDYWNAMTRLMSEWIYIDRTGELQTLPLVAAALPLVGQFQLSLGEFNALLEHSVPDAIINAIADSNPEALPETVHAGLYQQVVEVCAFAKEHHVEAFPDLVALAYVGILTNGHGLQNEELSAMLKRKEWKPGNLIDELADYVD